MTGAIWTIDSLRRELEALNNSSTYQKSNFYRDFAQRVKELFSDIQIEKGDDTLRTVEIIYANPERAIAKIIEGKTTNLPLLSIQFDGIELDNERRKPMEAIVEKKFWSTEMQRAIRYMAFAPVATNLSFAINVWGKYVEDVNQITEQIILKFRPNLSVEIRPSESYQAYIKDISESSNFQVGDRQDRLIKRVVRFEVQTYVPGKVFKFTNTNEIREINYEVYIEETSGLQTLESFYAGGGQNFALNKVPNRGLNITTSLI